MPEIWKDVSGYEGLYKVSNYGRVKSLYTNPPKIMKQTRSSTGYYHIQLYKNKKPETVAIHVIVARTFLGDSNGKEINHIDGVKSNNNVSNLEYVTKSENQLHAIKLGLRSKSPMTGRFGADSPTSHTILQYDLNGNFLKMWVGISETARILGVDYNSISCCINGYNKSAYGYMWRRYMGGEIPQKIEPCSNRKKGVMPHNIKRNRKCRPISQYSTDGKLVKVWDSYKEIEKTYKNSNGNIYKCISGKSKTAYGYIWKFAE
jgi:hypothetical protein